MCACVVFFFFFLPPFLKFAQSFLLKLKALCLPLLKVVMMTSSVSVAMEACDAGSLEMIHGWNMLSGFLGKYCCCFVVSFIQNTVCCRKALLRQMVCVSAVVHECLYSCTSLLTAGVNICSRRKDKTLFTRSKLDFLGFLSKLVKTNTSEI